MRVADHIMECGICHLNSDPSAKDCHGTCTHQYAVNEETNLCESIAEPQVGPWGGKPSDGGCDGTLNDCDVCVGGSAGLPATAGISSDCGYCVPVGREEESTVVWGCEDCEQTMDVCGRCVRPDEDLGRKYTALMKQR